MGNQQTPFVLFNTSLFEENNAVYDPNMINTNLLDVNFQNKFAFSTEQYFEGKMFEQNYTNYENVPIPNHSEFQQYDKNSDKISNDISEKKESQTNQILKEEKGESYSENSMNYNKEQNKEIICKDSESSFKAPENIEKTKDVEKKRRTKFDK